MVEDSIKEERKICFELMPNCICRRIKESAPSSANYYDELDTYFNRTNLHEFISKRGREHTKKTDDVNSFMIPKANWVYLKYKRKDVATTK